MHACLPCCACTQTPPGARGSVFPKLQAVPSSSALQPVGPLLGVLASAHLRSPLGLPPPSQSRNALPRTHPTGTGQAQPGKLTSPGLQNGRLHGRTLLHTTLSHSACTPGCGSGLMCRAARSHHWLAGCNVRVCSARAHCMTICCPECVGHAGCMCVCARLPAACKCASQGSCQRGQSWEAGTPLACYKVKVRLARAGVVCCLSAAACLSTAGLGLAPKRPPKSPPQSTMLNANAMNTSPASRPQAQHSSKCFISMQRELLLRSVVSAALQRQRSSLPMPEQATQQHQRCVP